MSKAIWDFASPDSRPHTEVAATISTLILDLGTSSSSPSEYSSRGSPSTTGAGGGGGAAAAAFAFALGAIGVALTTSQGATTVPCIATSRNLKPGITSAVILASRAPSLVAVNFPFFDALLPRHKELAWHA